jgi:hypothetical protein
VRVLAGVEVVLGGLALATSSELVAVLVVLSYAGFAIVTVVALVRDVPIDSCGCLGRLETPPGLRHLVVIGVALLGAVGQTLDPTAALLERVTDDGGAGVLFGLGVLVLTGLGVAMFRAGRRPSTPR